MCGPLVHRTSSCARSLLSAALIAVSLAATGAAQAPTSFEQAWQSGRPVIVTGVLTAMYADDFANRRANLVQTVRDERTGQSFQLRFEKEAARGLRSGARVRVVGRLVGSEIYLAACCDGTTSTSSSNVQTLSQPTAPPAGDQRTLVMVADLLDANVSCSVADIDSTLFAPPGGIFDANGTGLSVNAEYLDSSHGKLSWSGDVRRSALAISSTDPCDLSRYSQSLDAQAAASGVDVASYPHKLYVFPPMSQCPFIGASTLGGSPSSSYSFDCSTRGIYDHELGHAVGMSHAASYYSAYTAGSGAYENLLDEYGDYTDPMAASGRMFRGFNAPHREEMGWLSTTGAAVTQVVTQSGRYSISPLSIDPSTASAPQVLKIPKADDGGYYYLSYRGGQTFDQYESSYVTRVSVHRYGSPLDALSGFTFLYAALANGRAGEDTFSDPVNGIIVTMVSGWGSVPGSGAVVDVQITGPPCVRTTPVLAVSPQSQTGAAGGSPSYIVSVTNDDAPSCAPAVFNLRDAVPVGWSGTLSTDNLTLNAGGTGQTTLTVSSYGGSQVGTYTTTVNTSDQAVPVHAASTVATYTVLDTIRPGAPVNLTAVANNKAKQIQLSWGASSDNVGVLAYLVSRNGSIVAKSATTSWNDPAWTPGATYTYFVVADDAAGNMSAPSNGATVTISGGGGKKR
jgi:hypothetical protein